MTGSNDADAIFLRRTALATGVVAAVAFALAIAWWARWALLVIYLSLLVAAGVARPVQAIESWRLPRGWRVRRWIAALIIYVLVIGIIVGRRAAATDALLATGTAGTATITGLTQTGMYVNENPQIRMQLLVSLPGQTPYATQHTEIVPLYARLSAAEQHRVFSPHTGRRIVLATNVAETSLTVPGIRAVIDTGVARISRYSHRSRLQRRPAVAGVAVRAAVGAGAGAAQPARVAACGGRQLVFGMAARRAGAAPADHPAGAGR